MYSSNKKRGLNSNNPLIDTHMLNFAILEVEKRRKSKEFHSPNFDTRRDLISATKS